MMKIRIVSVALIFCILLGCQNKSLNLDEDVTRVDVHNWESEELIKSFEDTAFIESLVNKLNNAKGAAISDTSDIAAPPYKITFKNKTEILIELGLFQTENESRFMDIDNEIMYTVDTTIPID